MSVGLYNKKYTKYFTNLYDTHLIIRTVREYENLLEKLLPAKQRIALTDELIDQIVYRLYGLTEEEIRVVGVE